MQYKGGDGSSKEKAVIIVGAESELSDMDAHFEYIDL